MVFFHEILLLALIGVEALDFAHAGSRVADDRRQPVQIFARGRRLAVETVWGGDCCRMETGLTGFSGLEDIWAGETKRQVVSRFQNIRRFR